MGVALLHSSFWNHPKALAVGIKGREAYLRSVSWCSDYPSRDRPGFLPTYAREAICKPDVERLLVRAGLWDEVDDGWLIHDYGDWNANLPKSRTELSAVRAEAGSKGGSKTQANRRAKALASGQLSSSPVSSSCLSGTNAAAGSKPTRELSQQPPHDEPDGADLLPGVLASRGIHVTQRGLTRAQRDEIAQLAAIHGNSRLADSAYAQYQPDNPAGSIVAFLPGWRELPEPTQPRLSLAKCPHGTIADGRCEQCPQEAHA